MSQNIISNNMDNEHIIIQETSNNIDDNIETRITLDNEPTIMQDNVDDIETLDILNIPSNIETEGMFNQNILNMLFNDNDKSYNKFLLPTNLPENSSVNSFIEERFQGGDITMIKVILNMVEEYLVYREEESEESYSSVDYTIYDPKYDSSESSDIQPFFRKSSSDSIN